MSKATEPVPVPATEKPWQHTPPWDTVNGPVIHWQGLWAQVNPDASAIERGGIGDEDVAREVWGESIDDVRALLLVQEALANSHSFQSLVDDECDDWTTKWRSSRRRIYGGEDY